MLTKKGFMKLFILLMVVSLLLAACDRPLPSSDNTNETTQTNDNSYPAPTESTAVEGNTATDPGQPSEVEVPAEATAEAPAEAEGESSAGEVPSEGEVSAEATSEAPASEAEVPAEAEGESSAGEVEEVAEPSEVEVPAEASEEAVPTEGTEEVPVSEVEVPAEADEETTTEVEGTGTGGQSIPATHTVAAGENLYRIGLQYGISWVAIAQENGITNPDRIYAGQVLNLPGSGSQGSGGQPEPMPTPEGINYIVKPGDTLFKIAQQFHISWVEIAEANGLVNPNEIYAGQMIKIPVDAPMPPSVVHHVVQPGETLFRISLHYGLPWLTIANANQIGPPYVIYAGQTLIIPGGQ